MTTTTTHPATEKYIDYLKQEGYVPQLDMQGNIVFKREGLTYVLFTSLDDPNFLRLVCPGIWKIDSDELRARTLAALNLVCANIKVVKAFVVDDQVWVAAETFLETEESYKTELPRLLALVAFGVQTSVNQVRSQPPLAR